MGSRTQSNGTDAINAHAQENNAQPGRSDLKMVDEHLPAREPQPERLQAEAEATSSHTTSGWIYNENIRIQHIQIEQEEAGECADIEAYIEEAEGGAEQQEKYLARAAPTSLIKCGENIGPAVCCRRPDASGPKLCFFDHAHHLPAGKMLCSESHIHESITTPSLTLAELAEGGVMWLAYVYIMYGVLMAGGVALHEEMGGI
jgi:hypothetical protein